MEKLITNRQACELLQVCSRTLFNWSKSPDFPKPIRRGKNGNIRWRQSEIESWLLSMQKNES